jgi:hypothetical protein
MSVTLIGSKWVSGLLEFFKKSDGKTILKVTESGIEANVAGILTGGVIGMATIEKADSYELSAAEKAKLVISAKMTAGSKVLTLGLAAGQVAFVYNHGTETYTVKNVATDTGTSLETKKLLLVVGHATKNASTVIALN